MWKYNMIAGCGVWLAPLDPPILPTMGGVLEQEVCEEQWRHWVCSSRSRGGGGMVMQTGCRHHTGGTLRHQGNLCPGRGEKAGRARPHVPHLILGSA